MGCQACRDCGSTLAEQEIVTATLAGSSLSVGFPESTQTKQSERAAQMLVSVFKYYDKNMDGTLSFSELRKGIALTGLTLDYMKAADTDGDQKVSKQEFLNFFDPIPDKEVDEIRQWLLEKQSPAAKAMLLEVFAKYDKSGDGVLTVAEITNGIKGTGLALEYMLAADKDNDQLVTREEWLQFFDPIPDKEVEEMRAWLAANA
jgi:Ca2+-binding EF-hand superfamily protein